MSTAEIIMTAAVAVTPIASLIIAWLAFRRNRDNDTKEEGKDAGALRSDVGYIKKGIDGLERRLDRIDEKQDDQSSRLADVEATLREHLKDKAAHGWNK